MTEHAHTFSVEEAARILGCGRGTAYEAIRAGEIPSIKVGRRILVPRARLYALLGEDLPERNGHAEEVNPGMPTT
jgi:excisionase family DNA binding protein